MPDRLVQKARRLADLTRLLRQYLGAPLSDHTWVGAITGDTLVLVTDGSAWVTRLRYQQHELSLEELVVALADTLWKGKSLPELELEVKLGGNEPEPGECWGRREGVRHRYAYRWFEWPDRNQRPAAWSAACSA